MTVRITANYHIRKCDERLKQLCSINTEHSRKEINDIIKKIKFYQDIINNLDKIEKQIKNKKGEIKMKKVKTFNERVKRMYKSNVRNNRGGMEYINMRYGGNEVEYTDGKVLVRERDAILYSDVEARIKKCPVIKPVDVEYPKTDHVFPMSEVKIKIKFQKETLLKVLDLFENQDVITFDIRDAMQAVEFKLGKNINGLIMPCK